MRSIKIGNSEITLFDDGTIDEIFVNDSNGVNLFHLEKMDINHFWCCINHPAKDIDINMRLSAAAPIVAKLDTDEPQDWSDDESRKIK